MTSKRDVEARIDGLETPSHSEYPEAGLITIMSSETVEVGEEVGGGSGFVRCDGDVYRVAPSVYDALGHNPPGRAER